MTVYAATRWQTNGDLIVDCRELGYLQEDWSILDPTYGKGVWWKNWRPTGLIARSNLTEPEFDFRATEYENNTFDAIAYDPPYVCIGGRKTTGVEDRLYGKYGLMDAPKTPAALQLLINDGLTEMARIVKPKGFILVKCQDYVSSNKLWIGTHWTLDHALKLDLEVVDRFEHITSPRPQPPGRGQVHARRNLSTMLVFRKKK
jgi:tRNA G10  N-methylase Trm11